VIRNLAILVVTVHCGLVAYSATVHSLTWDELGHLPAGLSHWRFGRFDLYNVNPPLPRLLATLPLALSGVDQNWDRYVVGPGMRSEFTVGLDFLASHPDDWQWWLTVARWACLPFLVLGAVVSYRWASELFGQPSGLVALTIWCFCPNVMGHGMLVTPDVAASAVGFTACYLFWRWTKRPSWFLALLAGLALGLAQLTKMTWIVLFALWPVLWLICGGTARRRAALQVGLILVLALYVINFGYLFEGSFTRLGDFKFVSQTLAPEKPNYFSGNRFKDTWFESIPVPLPKNYVAGIDAQKSDFDRKLWSYLCGEWKHGGWWYFYLYASAIKVPLGTWMLGALACLFAIRRNYSAGWRDELVVLSPAVVVFTLVSSQIGFSHHLRYVLPAFPFVFVWISKVGMVFHWQRAEEGKQVLLLTRFQEERGRRRTKWRKWLTRGAVGGALGWLVASSLWVYPHSLSYYNQLVGGPDNGHYHLGNSNTDWGQDLTYLKKWLEENPQARPLGLAYDVPYIGPRLIGINVQEPPRYLPQPGWYAVSVNQIHRRQRDYQYFLDFQPAAKIGYTMHIYHITQKQVEDHARAATLRHHSGLQRSSDD